MDEAPEGLPPDAILSEESISAGVDALLLRLAVAVLQHRRQLVRVARLPLGHMARHARGPGEHQAAVDRPVLWPSRRFGSA